MMSVNLLLLRFAAAAASGAIVELPMRAPVSVPAAPALAGWTAPALSGLMTPALGLHPLSLSVPWMWLLPSPAPRSAQPLDLSPAAGVYERRGVGLLVLDAKDSTALHLAEGTRRARAMIRGVIDDAEAAGSAFDGRVIRRLGDGSLIAFPNYAAALGAAEAIQRGNAARRDAGVSGPELRVGVYAGRVLVDATGAAPEIYGRAVEKTLELAASADGGGIAVDQNAKGSAALPRRARVAARPLDSVRVERAATMFASLEGWNSAYERHGRRQSYAAVKTYHAYVRAAVERHGGFVVKNEGETVMATFTTAAAAVKAAADIQGHMADLREAAPLGRFFHSRVGLSWGRVIREERGGEVDFFGNTVNAAARLMRLSKDGDVMISGMALKETGVGGLVEGSEHEWAKLKGFKGDVTVIRYRPETRPRDAKAAAILRRIALRARMAIVPAPDAKSRP